MDETPPSMPAGTSGLDWAGFGLSGPFYATNDQLPGVQNGGMTTMDDIMSNNVMNNASVDLGPGHPFQQQFLPSRIDQSFTQGDYQLYEHDQASSNIGSLVQQGVPAFNDNSSQNTNQHSVIGQTAVPIQPPFVPNAPQSAKPCGYPGCTRTFTREFERTRHRQIHAINPRLFHCPIDGCPKHVSRAGSKGYKRPDKVTEHLWKKHADLGYVKRVN